MWYQFIPVLLYSIHCNFASVDSRVVLLLQNTYRELTAIEPSGLRIQLLLEQANTSIKNVQPFSLPSKEPWTQNPLKIILDLHKNKKSEVDSSIFKTEFLEIKTTHKHHFSIYTVGSKQDGMVACAVISPNFTDSIRLPDNSSIFTA